MARPDTKQVTEKHIREVMEHYGESLTDMGADYGEDFLKWFMANYRETYRQWINQIEDTPILVTGKNLLFYFSNESLGGLVSDTHDEILTDFCNQNYHARKHILQLFNDREED
jgi:hypothetical protein